MDATAGERSVDAEVTTGSGADRGRASGATAHLAAWLLVGAFVALVASVAAPAVSDTDDADVVTGLLFMLGLTAALVGIGLSITTSVSIGRTALGALVILAGLVLLYGLVPSLVALGVVLLGVALVIGSLPAD